MEVSLPPQQIPEDFNDAAGLCQQLEHIHEGHYSRRLYAYILEEMQHLLNSIAVDPALLPIREELIARVLTTDFVKNTFEQLATYHFERLEFNKNLEDLFSILDEAEKKMEELQNDTRGKRCWFYRFVLAFPKAFKKLNQAEKMTKIIQKYLNVRKGQLFMFQRKMLNHILDRYGFIEKQISEDILLGRVDMTDIDWMLRKCVLQFNAFPAAIKISDVSWLRPEQDKCFGKMNNITTSFNNWFNEEVPRAMKDVYASTIMYIGIMYIWSKMTCPKRI